MAQVFSSIKPQFSLTAQPRISQPTPSSNNFQTSTPSLSNALSSKINPQILGPVAGPAKPLTPPKPIQQTLQSGSTSAPAPTGYSNPFMAGGGNTQAPAPNNNTPVNIDYSNQENVYQKAARSLADQQQGNATSNAAARGLLGIAQNSNPEVQAATKNAEKLMLVQDQIANNPNVANEIASGRGQSLTGEINAAQQRLTNALSGQSQQISAGQSAGQLGLSGQSNQISAQGAAGNLTAPVAGAAFFGSPTSGNLVGGNTGANGATGNALVDSSVQAAIAKYKAGGNVNDARASLGSLGQPALNAFDQAINGGSYNPTAQGASANAAAAGVAGNVEDTQSISGAQNNIDFLTSLIQNSPELNKSGYNIQNAGYNILKKNMSNSDLATLDNSLKAINASISKVTGSPVDVAQLSTQEGTSLLRTINNQLQIAKGVAEGKLSGNKQTTAKPASGVKYNPNGTLQAVSF